MTSPLASPQSCSDAKTIADLGLKARILTHIRCAKEDAKVALETGVDGLDVVIGTSSYLRQFSHGKSIDEIIDLAADVLGYIREQAPHIELRFSTEDSFRSEMADLFASTLPSTSWASSTGWASRTRSAWQRRCRSTARSARCAA